MSAAATLEVGFLREIGRVKAPASRLTEVLATDFGVRVCGMPFRKVAALACHEEWTRDPFDRLIVANARAAGARLVTKEEQILRHYPEAIC